MGGCGVTMRSLVIITAKRISKTASAYGARLRLKINYNMMILKIGYIFLGFIGLGLSVGCFIAAFTMIKL